MGQPRPSIGAINFEVFFMSLVIWHQKSFQKLLHKTAIAAAQYFDRRRITECNFWQKMKVAVAKVIAHKYKWYFVTKIVLTYCEKNLFYWSRKTFEIRGWRLRIYKNFEITRTIYLKSSFRFSHFKHFFPRYENRLLFDWRKWLIIVVPEQLSTSMILIVANGTF